MLKLNAAYSKKVPADSQYSSQSYHCSIESELPDGLTPQQLQAKVHDVFDFVRNSVEAEIHNSAQVPQMPPPQQMPQQVPPQQMQPQMPVQQVQQMPIQPMPQQPMPQQQMNVAPQQNYQQPVQQYQQAQQPVQQGRQRRNPNAPASAKQVNYLLSLAKRAGWTIQQLLQRCGIPNIEAMPSQMCSQMIQEFSGVAA